jgi:nucleoside-diphosphate-sugar epimerase
VGTSINEVFARLKAATSYQRSAVHGPAKAGEVFKVYLNAEEAASGLGWTPQTSLEEGLRLTVEYFRTQA